MTPYYEQDGITIYHGDCRELAPRLGIFDCVIADPPYGETSLDWDSWPNGWLQAVATRCFSLWCFGSLRMFTTHWTEFESSNWRLSQDIVWEKHNGSGFASDRFRRVHEQVAHFYRGGWDDVYKQVPRIRRTGPRKAVRTRGQTPHTGEIGNIGYSDDGQRIVRSVIYAPSMQGAAQNETQKPEAIVGPLIEYASPVGGSILAPFMGSGTDLIVARELGRRATGIELRESQCAIAAERLRQGALFGVTT